MGKRATGLTWILFESKCTSPLVYHFPYFSRQLLNRFIDSTSPRSKGKWENHIFFMVVLAWCSSWRLGIGFDFMKDYRIIHPDCWIHLPPSRISSFATVASCCSSWLRHWLHCGSRESSAFSRLTRCRARESADETKLINSPRLPLRNSGGVGGNHLSVLFSTKCR